MKGIVNARRLHLWRKAQPNSRHCIRFRNTHLHKRRLLLPNPKPCYEGCRKKEFPPRAHHCTVTGSVHIAAAPIPRLLYRRQSAAKARGSCRPERHCLQTAQGAAQRTAKKTKSTRLTGQPRPYARKEKAPWRQSEPVAEAALSSPMHKGESQLKI